jgi:hypothetical protein
MSISKKLREIADEIDYTESYKYKYVLDPMDDLEYNAWKKTALGKLHVDC